MARLIYIAIFFCLAATQLQADPVTLTMALISTVSTAATTGAFIGGFLIGGAGTFLTHFVVTAALGFALNLLSPKPARQADSGYTVNARGGANAHAIIYGETVVGGVVFFDSVTNGNKYLHRCIALAGHECDGITTIYIDDEALTLDGDVTAGEVSITAPSKWAGKAVMRVHLGTDAQAADTNLVSRTASLETEKQWTADHKASGICYIYVRFEFDRDAFPNGVPVVTAKVKGKKIYNPSTLVTEWTDNAALVARDYFTSAYGLQAASTAVNDTAYIAAAAVCDEVVTVTGGTEARYTVNGSFSTESSPKEVVTTIHTHMAGFPAYAQGQWSSVPGDWTAPTKTLIADDLRGSLSVSPKIPRSSNFNGVIGLWRSEASKWQPTSYPALVGAGFVAEDNAVENLADLNLLMSDSPARCQRIAKIALYRNRQQMTVNAAFGLNAMDVAIGEVINLTYERWGWTNKTFECVSWILAIGEEGEPLVEMTLREISEAVFDWDSNVDEADFTADDTSLPDAFIASIPTIALSSELRLQNQKVSGALIVSCTASTAGFIDTFEVEFRQSTDTEWTNLGLASGGKFEALDVQDVLYDVRARTINTFGVRSAWAQTDDFLVSAFSDAPSDVTDFRISVVDGNAHLAWTASPDLDLSHYRVRHSSKLTGANFDEATTVVDKIARPATSVSIAARSGTYFVQAYDKTGNASPAPPSVTTNILSIQGLNVIEDIDEHTTFTGTKTDTEVVDTSFLAIESVALGGTAPIEGIYEFATATGTAAIDLGAKYTSRVWSTVAFVRDATAAGGALFDSTGGLFDSGTGLFDGQVYSDIDVKMEINLTDDDPTASPTWSGWVPFTVGDFAARAMRFRVLLQTDTTNVTPRISELSVSVDMPDRTIAEADLVSGAGTYAVTFTPAFKALGGVGISAQGLATGDYYSITSKSATGFTIQFFNSSDTTISRTFDYVARGYGKAI